ncbi:MAG: ABC transporter substrate-binding protein [Rhizobiaceae bacterium]|nr:ABC transporter substrate-binding protein [Rhizobiaceae bacterium]
MFRLIRCAAIGVAIALSAPALAQPSHGLAMHGEPGLQSDFAHLPYANPDAPKGGRINYAWQGSFDSLNPFIVAGDGARGLFDAEFGNNVFDTLMMRSRDEAFTLYPLLAESVETDAERSFVQFTLNPAAKFSDGQPVTPQDVIFTYGLLREKARPIYRSWIGVIDKMEVVGERGVRFTFNEKADRESPLLLAMLPILPKHATDVETFDKSSLKPLTGSGPYVVGNVRPGEVVVLKRNPDYWAKDLPTKRGLDNYDEIRINYFRDTNTIFEAFKKGLVDIQVESDPVRWSSDYGFPAVADGRVKQSEFERRTPSGMYGFVLNTRRAVFKDRAVRAAIAGLFDFEWANRNLFADGYTRTKSYFDGSELSASGVPASEAEKALLAPFPDAVRPDVMDGTWVPPVSDGSGRDRAFLKKGFDALKATGYELRDNRMTGPDGKQLTFEILLNGKSGEALSLAWQRTLASLGIAAQIRSVDSAQYLQRQRTYDFDAMLMNYTASLSPGVEQQFRWGSASRDQDGTYNFAGAAEPAIDAVIAAMVGSRDRASFVTAVRALDRLLLSGAYVVPLYYQPRQWVAHWANIRQPEKTSLYGVQMPTWWDDGSRKE